MYALLRQKCHTKDGDVFVIPLLYPASAFTVRWRTARQLILIICHQLDEGGDVFAVLNFNLFVQILLSFKLIYNYLGDDVFVKIKCVYYLPASGR